MSSTVTIKQKSEYYYLKCVLEREESDKMTCIILEPVKLRSLIGTALKQLHGLVGASITVDVLKCEQSNGEIILRVKANNLVKVWSSLTLFSNYNGSECRFRVKQRRDAIYHLLAKRHHRKNHEDRLNEEKMSS